MTNASLLDELGKSPVNPFPRNVRLSRGVKGGKGFTSELPFITLLAPEKNDLTLCQGCSTPHPALLLGKTQQ